MATLRTVLDTTSIVNPPWRSKFFKKCSDRFDLCILFKQMFASTSRLENRSTVCESRELSDESELNTHVLSGNGRDMLLVYRSVELRVLRAQLVYNQGIS